MGIIDTTHKSLLSRIREGDEVSWYQFYQTYKTLVYMHGKSIGLQEADTEELLSRVMLKFFNIQKKFTYRPELGRFRDYFRRMIASVAIDILREKKKNCELPTEAESIPDISNEARENESWQKEWEAHIFEQSLQEVKARLPARAIQAFMMCKLNEESPQQVGKFLGVSQATVYNDCNLVWDELKKTIKKLSEDNHI